MVIGFDGVICVLLGDVARGGYYLLDHSRVGRWLVGDHLSRAHAVLEGAEEEPAAGCQLPLLRHQHVDDLAILIDRPVQIHPPPGDLHVRLVHEPAITGGVPAGSCRVDQQRGEPLHSPIDSHMVDVDATLGQQFLDVSA
jgi:hypothetical protein